MAALVFLEPNKIDAEPFTTSDIVAECAEVSYRSVQRIIEKYENDLKEFGILRFEITVSGKAGRPKNVYHLNEEQATLLITYLKNTPVVRTFKKELVRQFYSMRNELNRRHIESATLKPIRRELTDVIKQVDSSSWAYKKYTDLAYLTVTGKTAKKLRKERNAPPNAKAVDYMTADELHSVTEMQYRIGVLLEMGMDYQRVKATLSNRLLLKSSA